MATVVYLNFHGLGDPGAGIPPDEVPYWLPAERFAEIVERVVRLARPVRITFDDGNLSDLALAVPILGRAGLAAQFFLVSDRIGLPGYLSEPDIRALARAGMGVGTHGAAHVRWTGLADGELRRHVADSTGRLSAILSTPVTEAAIPFGAYDRRVLGVLRGCGLTRVHSSDRGPARSTAWLVPRNSIRADTGLAQVDDMIRNRFPLRTRIGSLLHRLSAL